MSLNKRGDTIVEVMLVLAVLGLAMSIAYATANRALLNIRAAQENATASKMVQSQIEQLRLIGPISDSSVPTKNIFRATDFCVDSSGLVQDSTNAACNDIDGLYSVNISFCNLSSNTACTGLGTQSTFVAKISWPNVRGQGTDTVTMVYRVFQ